MATLFGVDFTATIGAAFAGQLRPMTLHHVATAIGANGDTVAAFVDHACEGVVAKWSEAIAAARGYTPVTVKIVLLQAGLPVPPSTDDDITAAGKRWRVVDVSQDPGEAVWTLAAVPAGGV